MGQSWGTPGGAATPGASRRALARRESGVAPPTSNTGAEITVHWLRGGFHQPVEDVLELVNSVTDGSYCESLDWGRYMYGRQHVFLGGVVVYVDPKAPNMAPVMVDCPGSSCEQLGFEKLQVLFCNADLSRVDVAYDHAPFTPRAAAEWARAGNVRTRAKKKKFEDDLGTGDGETLKIGSRSSDHFLRVYDARGFTRVELEMKGAAARAFKSVLLSDADTFVHQAVGVLREFVDFVDRSSSANISRCGNLPSWELFTQGLERVKLRVAGVVVDSLERVADWLEGQVAATLYTYHRAGRSVGDLLQLGKGRMSKRHRVLLAAAGVLSP